MELENQLHATVQRLSALSPLEYDQVRKLEAKALGVRSTVLDTAVGNARKQGGSDNLPFPIIEPWPEPIDPVQLLSDNGATMKHNVARKQQNSKMCFVCGLKNGSGLQASFYETENSELVALFVPTIEHQSYPGRMHGGIASAILDETIGRTILVGRNDDFWGVTIELQVQYKKPIPLETEIKVIARLTEEGNRFFKGSGEIVLPNGDVAVTAQGRYMKVSLDKIADFDPEENEWRVVVKEDDPESIEL